MSFKRFPGEGLPWPESIKAHIAWYGDYKAAQDGMGFDDAVLRCWATGYYGNLRHDSVSRLMVLGYRVAELPDIREIIGADGLPKGYPKPDDIRMQDFLKSMGAAYAKTRRTAKRLVPALCAEMAVKMAIGRELRKTLVGKGRQGRALDYEVNQALDTIDVVELAKRKASHILAKQTGDMNDDDRRVTGLARIDLRGGPCLDGEEKSRLRRRGWRDPVRKLRGGRLPGDRQDGAGYLVPDVRQV